MKFAKPKKISTSKLRKKAAILFSQLIRKRGRCEAAGKDYVNCGGSLQCAHIVTRGVHHLAFDEMNALCLCAGHHRYYTTRNDEWFWSFIPKYFPANHNYLLPKRNTTQPFKVYDLMEIIQRLESKVQQ